MHPLPLRARLVAGMQGHLFVTVLILIASFAAQAGIARRFAFRGLGEYTATTAVIYLVSVFLISGLPLAAGERVARHLEVHDERAARHVGGTGFVLATLASVLGGLAVWASWPALADVMQLREPVPSEAVAAAVVAAGMLGYVQPVYMARLQFAMVGLVAIAQPFTVVVALGIDTISPGIRPGAMAVGGYLSAGVLAGVVFWLSGHRPWLYRASLRSLLPQALRSLPLVYMGGLQAWVNRLLVSVLLGTGALGTYQGAAALIEGALRLPSSANAFLVSAYARVSVTEADKVRRLVRLHLTLGTTYVAVFGAMLIAGAEGILATIFGPGSAAAATPLRILALSLVPGMLMLSLATALTGAGAARIAVVVARIAIPAQVALLVVAAPAFGVNGAAVAHLAAVTFGALTYARWSARHGTLPPEGVVLRSVTLGILAAAVGGACALLPIAWPARALVAAAAVGAFAAVLLVGPSERALISSMVRRQSSVVASS